MNNKNNETNKVNEWQPDSLMELLIAQCADLEGLLALARRETVAAQREDFGELVAVFGDRARIGDRLETYHRQVAELRARLGQTSDTYIDPALSSKTVQLAIEIQTQDAQTTSLLRITQARTTDEIARLNTGHRNSLAYLSGARANGLNCDRQG